jgi:hypothetical protein
MRTDVTTSLWMTALLWIASILIVCLMLYYAVLSLTPH